ncbi:2',5'-phosphodiesterase 12 isoform X2 [Anthonomus grandis grandis]|uniref:2',5'-phosphodiesterase 12 isoform X2 n=1 Tax=Anthonomus grandis grandis TaxID=2921223 RepID=UPI0021668115|nr:2',5'-phosphodiesterase 12 isoform X2 [Anthonomus grandis grandis]
MFFKPRILLNYKLLKHIPINKTVLRGAKTAKLKMNKAYVRHSPDGEFFDLNFALNGERIKRPFNFTRKVSETVETLLTRVKTNVDKAANKKKKKKDEEPYSSSVSLMLNSTEVPKEELCERVFVPNENLQLSVNNEVFKIVINSPWVIALKLPTSILAGFPTYPSTFETVYTEKDLSTFTWYSSKDKKNWEPVGNDFIYTPQNSDINHYLKFTCLPRGETSEGPIFEDISTCKVEASPGECPFETRHLFTKHKLVGDQFRVVSYNLLADLYCDSDFSRESLFPYCPHYALSIDYRKQLFTKEIIGYNADIICLQEVDKKIFKYDLNTALSHLGYSGQFDLKGGVVAEGLAFFYNTKRFILLDSSSLVFADHLQTEPVFRDIWERIKSNEKLSQRILGRTTTLQVNVVGSLEQDEILVVANTHLYFHPDSDHIRLLHGCLAIRYLEHFVKGVKERYEGKRVSLVFCGDFNSVPSCGIYQLYTRGLVPGDFIDYKSNLNFQTRRRQSKILI